MGIVVLLLPFLCHWGRYWFRIFHACFPSKITTVSDPSLFGTTKYPIQLVQSGNVFRTLQPLNNNQVTQIAKVLKTKQGYKDPEIVYEDTKNRRKLVYTH